MIWSKLAFGGFGRRGVQAIAACIILAVVTALLAGAFMVVQGGRDALAAAEREDRPDIVQVKSRFNRALFETPRSGNLPPLTIPVYEPLIEPEKLTAVPGAAAVVARQSLFRNVVSGAGFSNAYVFGIEPDKEIQASRFSVSRGRFLRTDDYAVAVIDAASARALNVDIGQALPVRKADGEDLRLSVVGILDCLDFRGAPPRTVEAPGLPGDPRLVTGGVFVTLRTSEQIFGRSSLTDALVVARAPEDVPMIVDQLREAFRLEPGVFVTERYSQFQRKVHDFTSTLALFTGFAAGTALLAGSFIANLLYDVFADRVRQYGTLIALGFSPARGAAPGFILALTIALSGTIAGVAVAVFFTPRAFVMPSLMADLGTIEPRFRVLVAATVAVIASVCVLAGAAPVAWRLGRRPIAATLSESGR